MAIEHLSGKMIVLDGIDGAGKSTHATWIVDWLRQHMRKRDHCNCKDVLMTREPGGTKFSEALRDIIFNWKMTKEAETLLMFAARHQHLLDVIFPALKRGTWIVCDRFTDATFAYQGAGKGVNMNFLSFLESYLQSEWSPDLVILFDLPVNIAMQRCMKRKQRMSNLLNIPTDRFEDEDLVFFEKVRAEYLKRARENPKRYFVIDAAQNIQFIRSKITSKLKEIFNSYYMNEC